MGDAGYIVSIIIEIIGMAFSSLSSHPIFGDYTILDICITLAVLEITLGVIFALLGREFAPYMEKEPYPHPNPENKHDYKEKYERYKKRWR